MRLLVPPEGWHSLLLGILDPHKRKQMPIYHIISTISTKHCKVVELKLIFKKVDPERFRFRYFSQI